MCEDVRSDAELLEQICNESPHVVDRVTGRCACLCPKQLAAWTDRSVQTISDYRTGKTNIPAEFWKRLLEHHFDPRVFDLFVPVAIDLEWAVRGAEIESPSDFFREAVRLMGAHHEQQRQVAELLADGRIDELDAATVQAYSDAHARHRSLDYQLHRAILHKYRAECARKAGVR